MNVGATPFVPKDWKALALLAVLLAALPLVARNDYYLFLFNVVALNALVVLGLNLLIGCAGQISLGHAAFYGMGAYLSAIPTTTWNWPLAAGLLSALLVVALVSYLLAVPTLRLEGHYLVMATLGFNIIVSILLNLLDGITGGPSGFPGIPHIAFGSLVLDSDREFYYFIWSLFLAIFALTLNLTDSRMGRALQAIHEKELTAQALGIPSHRYKVLVFVISAIYAAVAGFCYAHYVTFISPKSFDIFYSVQIVTMVVVGGMGNLWGGLAGTALLTCLPEVLQRFEDLHVLLYGLILMGVLTYCPQGLLPALLGMRMARKDKARMQSGWSTAGRTAAGAGEPAPFLAAALTGQPAHKSAHHPAAADSAQRLPVVQLDDISLSFGGLQALDRVSMEVLPGEIVALIGPNGAGKTTLLNVVSGLLKPQNGTIHLEGQAIIGLPPYQVSARGVGRTFQTVQMYQRLTVLENVLLGYHVQGRAGIAAAFLHTPAERTEEQRQRQNALALLGSLQMAGKASWTTQQLTLLEQKLLELLRALALSPRLLLLDEPVGGLNPRERDLLKEFISLLRQRGMGIVLVEHDMDFVMRLADRIVVLQHGSRIATGTPEEIRRNPRVITAYLGVRKA